VTDVCDDHPTTPTDGTDDTDDMPRRPSRRRVIAGGASLALAALVGGHGTTRRAVASVEPVTVAPGLDIVPRDAWGADLPPTRTIADEDDVRVLLVHHTASSNSWSAINTMRVAYQTHTRQKGWADVAYNVFVARDGTVYEGRAGSLVRPKTADATGGSQGYSQLVCLLGDYTAELPTAEARASLVKVLAWMAVRSQVPTQRGSTCEFVSQGSNKYPAGTPVVSPTIAPHRQMTFTSCPGNRFAPEVNATLMRDVQRQRAAWRTSGPWPAVRLGPVEP
jgi:hypothetical protein